MIDTDPSLAIVDGILKAADPALSARYSPADDESVDAEFEILRCGEKTAVSIQICLYGDYSTNRYFYDTRGELEASRSLYFGNSLRAAARKAVAAL